MALTSFHLRLANWIDRTQGASRICLNPLSFGHRFGAYVVIEEARDYFWSCGIKSAIFTY